MPDLKPLIGYILDQVREARWQLRQDRLSKARVLG